MSIRVMGDKIAFKQKLFAEYPIPEYISIFGSDGQLSLPIADLDLLIASCVDELKSDIFVTDYLTMGGMTMAAPEGCVAVVNAKFSAMFQGNRSVPIDFDRAANQLLCRYVPARVTYRRYLRLSDLEGLVGDQLIYVKSYVLWKMAEKEVTVLQSVELNADNGSVNLSALASFGERARELYLAKKEDILIYSAGR